MSRGLNRAGGLDLLVIGSSTGGPDALATVLGDLPGDLPVPVAVVQHMPPIFTRMLAERLNSLSRLTIVEAEDEMPLQPGLVLLAPGGRHLELVAAGGTALARLSDEPPENYCRPAVDVLFGSAAATFGAGVLGVVLTGMGKDGTRGSLAIREAGGQVFAQDEATSVVWGMPGAVVAAGAADRVIPLPDLAGMIAGSVRQIRRLEPRS